MPKVTYGFAPGSRGSGDPNKVAKALSDVKKKHGKLTAEATVEEASNPSNYLHDSGNFTWDKNKAAHEFNLIEARQLIRAVVVVQEDKSTRREYVWTGKVESSGEESRAGSYESMAVVVTKQDTFQNALESLLTKLNSASASVQELKDAATDPRYKNKAELISVIMKSLSLAITTVNKMAS